MQNTQSIGQESALQRYIFPAYLAFSICFYSQRFIFGWGASLTTFDSDMPWYLAVLKDVAWILLLGSVIVLGPISRALAQLERHSVFYATLLAFCVWVIACGIVHVMFFEEPPLESLLYNLRMPLEYVPAALLAPVFIGDFSKLGKVWKGLNLLAIAFAIYEVVAVAQGWKTTGFGWGGVNTRFGGIFGSANDWGVYCGGAILVLLSLHMARLQLLAFVPGLILSQSRSALIGTLVASIALFRAPRQIWRLLLLVVAVPLLLAVAFQISGASWDEMLPVHAGVDESALERLEQMAQFRDSFIRSDSLVAATVGTRRFHSETFYLALIIRAGVPALVLYMAVIASTLIRGWNLRARSRIHAAALCFVLLVCVSSLFIPNLDSYPTNFYFWLGVGVIWMEPSELALKNETRAAASRLRAVPASF